MKGIFIVTDNLGTNAHQRMNIEMVNKEVHNFKCIFHSFGKKKKLYFEK